MKTSAMILLHLSSMLSLSSTLLFGVSPAYAQADAKAAAHDHFKKGVDAFDDKRFGEAAEEFDAAYKLSPAFAVLYNIGQVDVALGRSVEAVDAFDKYLKQGASTISAARKQEVRAEIEKQLSRIGTVAVRTFPEAAEVRIDGRLVGKTPLSQPIRLTAGRHTVEAILAGHGTQVRDVDVVGRAEIAIEMTLEAIVAAGPDLPATPAAPIVPLTPAAQPQRSEPPAAKLVATKPETQIPSSRADSSVSWQRVLGYVASIGGLATATVGGVMAYNGSNQASDAKNRLANAATGAEYDMIKPDFDAAESRNRRGWIVAGIGTAVLAGGILLIATAPQGTASISMAPSTMADGGGLVMGGIW
jgi:hypothetical protein